MQTIGTVSVLSRESRPGPVGLLICLAGALLGAGALAWWAASGWSFATGPMLMVGALLVVLPIRSTRRQAQARRTERVLTAWGAERGLVFQASTENPSATPTLKERGLLTPVLVGAIGGDPHGFLAHYTYIEGSGKNQHAVNQSLAVARFDGREGLRVHIRSADWLNPGGLFDDWKGLNTPSSEINDRFAIEVREGHDPVQVLELLDPVALTALLDTEVQPVVEIDEGHLVIVIGGHVGITPGVEDLAWFELLRTQADAWGARIAGI